MMKPPVGAAQLKRLKQFSQISAFVCILKENTLKKFLDVHSTGDKTSKNGYTCFLCAGHWGLSGFEAVKKWLRPDDSSIIWISGPETHLVTNPHRHILLQSCSLTHTHTHTRARVHTLCRTHSTSPENHKRTWESSNYREENGVRASEDELSCSLSNCLLPRLSSSLFWSLFFLSPFYSVRFTSQQNPLSLFSFSIIFSLFYSLPCCLAQVAVKLMWHLIFIPPSLYVLVSSSSWRRRDFLLLLFSHPITTSEVLLSASVSHAWNPPGAFLMNNYAERD